MLRQFAALATGALTTLLAGCDEGPSIVTDFVHGTGGYDFMVAASADGPVLVEIHNPPFPADAGGFEAALFDAMQGAAGGRQVSYTTAPAAAATPRLRLVFVFDPDKGQSRQDVCAGDLRPFRTTAAARPTGERIDLVATFCDRKRLLVAVRGWVEKADGPRHDRFRKLIHDATRALYVRQG